VDVGRDVNVYADVDVLKLGIDQRVNAYASDTGLERSVATGSREPILSEAFWPSRERI